jgi:hypothetical protein
VAKFSRFQNLEHERPVRGEAGHGPLERFEGEALAPKGQARGTGGQAPDPVQERFAAEQSSELRLAQGDFSRLPSLECGACGTENGKFDVACRTCGSRMDTEASRMRNQARLTQQLEQLRVEHELVGARRSAELEQATQLKVEQRRMGEQLAREIAQRVEHPRAERGTSVRPSTVALAVLVLIVILSHSLLVALPASVAALAVLAMKLGLVGKRFPGDPED